MASFAVTGNDVARCVLRAFETLPAKRKPLPRGNGVREWVPLSGIVLTRGNGPMTCVSLGTGMKCLPVSKVERAKGVVLHDWHAEIVAVRAFNRFLLQECAILAKTGAGTSAYLRRCSPDELRDGSPQPFSILEDVRVYMYCSEAPCGDASMELVMRSQEDATPWHLPPLSDVPRAETSQDELRGRGYFSELGIVRRKPARPDAPQTLSKSCSDKLTMYQCTSLLGSVCSTLVRPDHAYIHTLILPESQCVPEAVVRAFGPTGRMSALNSRITGQWNSGYAFRPFEIGTTDLEFAFSRRSGSQDQRLVPSNVSAVYTPHTQETLVGGTLQGRKQYDPQGASVISRKSMWAAAVEVATLVPLPSLAESLSQASYRDFKSHRILSERAGVKNDVKEHALKGWVRNVDDTFTLELGRPSTAGPREREQGPSVIGRRA
ncbi:tRNA-specific adenosine deaminase [Trichodelitschia bisporula]|uniref:tRNA-specific adenosine deaminase n=1 Tax=Trichodelitschia bisporula TaxID=703511 RepID=A0A6G1I6E1_9PEZI|nr:tRNA-specific adenosine deaminase [Trichodelitschia bisporula]